MTRSGVVGTLVWTVLIAVAVFVVARAHYTTDLSAFLPRTPTAAQRLLVDQLRDGLASRLIIVAIDGSDSPTRARVSQAMAAQLRGDPQFVSVNNGESAVTDRDRQFLFSHRYLLSDSVTPSRFTVAGVKEAIQDTIDLLASPAGLLAKELLPHDPTGEMVQIVGQLASGGTPRIADGVWASGDGKRAMMVAQTRAPGSDTDGQQRAVEAVKAAFAAAAAGAAGPTSAGSAQPASASNAAAPAAASSRPTLLMSGPGVFAVAARANIIKEVTRLSILSTMIIVALLLGVYRSVAALVLGLVPVASGALAGIAAVALGVGVVHGITLGFGITLIGEAVDYSIYLFIQSQRRPAIGSQAGHSEGTLTGASAGWQRSVWPTIRLGMLTSVCGFASLLPSGFSGLAQLGLYSIAGLAAAALVTRFVLPHWLPRNFAIRDVSPVGVAVSRTLERVKGAPIIIAALALAAGAVVYLHRNTLWNRELSALSPVSLADQDLDAQMRVDIRAPDVRYMVIVSAPDEQIALDVADKVSAPLNQLIDQDVIGGFDSPAHYLPSLAVQRARQASLPPPDELRSRLHEALEGLPVRADRLDPFLEDVATARAQPLLSRKDLDNTSLASGFDALMVHGRQGWVALMPLRASASNPSYIDERRVRDAVEKAAPGQATVLDIKGEADSLYSTYLSEAVRLSLGGFAAIVILLLIALRSPLRVIRVVMPLALAVLTVTGGFVLMGRQLTILHVIGMLLIIAVGSNYALFFDRRANDAHPGSVPLTLASLLIANIATVVSFGILAFSTVPVLTALGSTVAPGALLALVFSALLARHLPTPGPRAAVASS
jgi:predicted exporter